MLDTGFDKLEEFKGQFGSSKFNNLFIFQKPLHLSTQVLCILRNTTSNWHSFKHDDKPAFNIYTTVRNGNPHKFALSFFSGSVSNLLYIQMDLVYHTDFVLRVTVRVRRREHYCTDKHATKMLNWMLCGTWTTRPLWQEQ